MSEVRDPDLRDALRPLAGEPSDAWMRIRAALPEPPGVTRPVWRWVAAAAAAGLVLGFATSRLTTVPPAGRESVAIGADEDMARVVGMAGDLVVETDAGVRPLAIGDRTVLDRFVATAPEGRAIIVLPGDVELRLDKGSRVALLGRRSLELSKGQVFLKVPKTSGPVHLATMEGEVVASPGAVQVSALGGRTDIVALDGGARFEAFTGEIVELASSQRVACVDGALGDVESVDLAWDHIAWQIDLLAGCADRREEAHMWAFTLIEALDRPAVSDRAERALRGAGTVGAVTLGMAAYDLAADRQALRKRCWLLLAQLGDASSVSYLLGGPSETDADVRAATVAAIERITAIPSGKDADFWRDASPAQRYDVLTVWRERLQDF